MKFQTKILSTVLLISLNGCSSIHETRQHHFETPAHFDQNLEHPSQRIDQAWWHYFNSSQLSDLIEQALQNSPDLKIATERVLQAEYALRSVGASRYPSLNLTGRSGSTTNFPAQGDATTSDSTSLNIGASYELDLWQRNAAAIKANQANLTATEFDWVSAQLSLTSSVAQTYFEVIALKERVNLAQENVNIAQRLLEIVEIKKRNGAATALDVNRQKTALLNQRAALIPLENQFKQSQTALAILVGAFPQGFEIKIHPLEQISMVSVTAGLPSELLTRRPDIAASELRLFEADVRIHLSKADLLPKFTLTATGGIASDALLSLTSPTGSLALASSISQSLYDGGQSRNDVLTSESQYRVALENHRKTILNALFEVEQALGNVNTFRAQENAQLQTQAEAQRALQLAEFRYQEGADDLSTVLDAQRTLFQVQEQIVQLRQQRLNATVDLYKVLGGGWERPVEIQSANHKAD